MNIFNRRVAGILRYVLLASLAIASTIASPRAQTTAPANQTSEDRIALHQALLDLTNPWTVMCVAAHPDDEDGTSLVVMRRKYGAHTVSLFSTFGEGGQNAIGPELYEELGAIRARETMAASEIQGSEPYFLGLRDFGFSKSRDETFQKWGQEEALRRMVLHIRKLRPDVIITNHSTTSNDHGHHQATARLVVEAFDAAADPTKFPEQLKDGVTTWQVQRLFVRVRGNQPLQNPDRQGGGQQIVTIDPNERDPVRGTLFAEQALSALQKHATQGPWPKTFAEFTARFRAFSGQGGATGQMPLIRYRLDREAKGAAALGSQAHNFLEGLEAPPELEKVISSLAIRTHSVTDLTAHRGEMLASLLKLAQTDLSEFLKHHTTRPMLEKANALNLLGRRLHVALARLAGIQAELRSGDDSLVVRDVRKPLIIKITNHGYESISVEKAEVHYPVPLAVAPEGSHVRLSKFLPSQQTLAAPSITPLYFSNLLPHFLRLPRPAGLTPLPIREHSITVEVVLHGVHISVPVTSALEGLPDVEINTVSPQTYATTRSNSQPAFIVSIKNHRNESFAGRLSLQSASGTRISTSSIDLKPKELRSVAFLLPSDLNYGAKPTDLKVGRPFEAVLYVEENQRIPAAHWIPLSKSATLTIGRAVATVTRNLRIGYVRGFDFSLPNALNALGVESKELNVDEVKTSDLSKYSSIIVDNRVYESQPELIAANQKLLDYANTGGNLIVFYHRIDEFNPNPQRNRPQLSPYKLILGNERITDENAPISFLEPEHPLLNSPNKLNQDDFKDWIQERGLYYPREWDPQFKALLQSNDPGEAPLKGGLLVADYGKGHYIYTSMVWYRQLRAGVPGAYRMLANMVSYGR